MLHIGIIFFSGKPTLNELIKIEGNGKTVRIIDTVAAKWESVAIGLNIEHVIETRHLPVLSRIAGAFSVGAVAGGSSAALVGAMSGSLLGPIGAGVGVAVGAAMGAFGAGAGAGVAVSHINILEVFSKWLEGRGRKPITWATLIIVLNGIAEFSNITHDLEDILSKMRCTFLIITERSRVVSHFASACSMYVCWLRNANYIRTARTCNHISGGGVRSKLLPIIVYTAMRHAKIALARVCI